jgi:chromosomal replication initiation ATPase DnaA
MMSPVSIQPEKVRLCECPACKALPGLEMRLAAVESGGSRDARIAALLRDAAELTGLRIIDIVSEQRDRSLVQIRQAVAWCARKLHGLSNSRIGFSFGGRDPSTIQHAIQMAESLRTADQDFRKFTDALVKRALARRGGK